MSLIRIGWDAPAAPVDRYEVRWFFGTVQVGQENTLTTELSLVLINHGAYRFEVRAVLEGRESEPAVLDHWFEEFEVNIHLGPVGIIVAWQSMVGRVYALERSVDGNKTWAWVADYLGDGGVIEAGGGQDRAANFRVWSKPSAGWTT